MSASGVGLAISSTITMAAAFEWGVRQSAAVESHMISVERVVEYSRLPSEAATVRRPSIPRIGRPAIGDIRFENVSVRYAPDRLVLKNITCHIRAREKVGIVGRTGSGKSTLIESLFRLNNYDGCIRIDGVDTQTLELHRLRAGLSIIPQDPVLFSGTLRKNLDGHGDQFSDDTLWQALEAVELKEALVLNSAGLEATISEGGVNLSVGQRQLICLARALLRRCRVLILDEATAAIDRRTDWLIQRTIRQQFCDCTVLTIAQRLDTVIDCDRILVLQDGYLQEFDEPTLLLQDPMSAFSKLVTETGRLNARRLTAMARKAYNRRHRNGPVRPVSSHSGVHNPR